MGRKQKQLVITYETLAEITGKSAESVRQDATAKGYRKGFNIEDPISVLTYLSANAPLHLKTAMFRNMVAPSGHDRRRVKKRRARKR